MKVMIMAGGTGGHVFPGIAIAHALQNEGVTACWLGTEGGMEKNWVEQAGIEFDAITIKGLRGNGLAGWLKAPFNVLRAWWQSWAVMRRQKPDLVLGMGGFVCGPGGLAAKFSGVPLVVHEQNAIPGLTNKLLAPLAVKVLTAFPQQALKGSKVEQVGNPVRDGLESIAVLQQRREKGEPLNLLVLGGSRGALALNETVPQALARMSTRLCVRHQTGEKTLEKARQAYAQAGIDAEVVPFIEDMAEAYRQADMVVCRAGALTVSELMAAARPAILVPYPHAVDDHQTANAEALVALGGGEVVQQSDLNPQKLADTLQSWLGDDKRVAASQSIRRQAPQGATQNIVRLLMNLMNREERT